MTRMARLTRLTRDGALGVSSGQPTLLPRLFPAQRFPLRQGAAHQVAEQHGAAVVGAGAGDGVGVGEEIPLHVAHGKEPADGLVGFRQHLGVGVHMDAIAHVQQPGAHLPRIVGGLGDAAEEPGRDAEILVLGRR